MRRGTAHQDLPVDERPRSPCCTADLAVVIPTHDRPELVVRALDCVLRQSVLPAEVMVVDVGGRSWSQELQDLADAAPTRVIVAALDEPAHAGRARNHGARRTSSTALAFLDDDDSWNEEYLAQALTALQRHPNGLVVTPLLVRRAGAVLALPAVPQDVRAADVLARNPGVTGTNIVVSRSVLEQVGGFDEQLAAFNDLDLLVRLLDRGVPVVPTPLALAEQLLHASDQLSEPSPQRLNALALYEGKHGHRMTGHQRRQLRRERHWMQARLAGRSRARAGHRVAQMLLTSPRELAGTVSRRWHLRERTHGAVE
ncbi:MAG: hypothetical protein JWP14_2019 [Frankiales bacterium]|jgi:GT2 family glycosyltransferase|nr:hypothetical protein [Frankiales bacterium]